MSKQLNFANKALLLPFLYALGLAAVALVEHGQWLVAVALVTPEVVGAIEICLIFRAFIGHPRFPAIDRADIEEVLRAFDRPKTKWQPYRLAVRTLDGAVCAFMILAGGALVYPGIALAVVFAAQVVTSMALDALEDAP